MILLVIVVLMSTVAHTVGDSKGLYSGCNTWSAWTNNNKPDMTNTADEEHVSHSEITSFCSPDVGGVVTKIQCQDDGGEAISGNFNNPELKFNLMCGKLNADKIDVVCKPFNGSGALCPDYSVQYYCECPLDASGDLIFVSTKSSTLSTSVKTTPVTTTEPSTLAGITTKMSVKSTTLNQASVTYSNLKTSTTNLKQALKGTPSSKRTNNEKQQSDQLDQTFTIGDTTISWWLIMTIICALLFIVNIILTICLHKKAVRKNTDHERLSLNGSSVWNRRNKAAVSPLNAV